MRDMAREARLRMMRLVRQKDTLATVAGVEQRTSMNDARIALCVAMGVDLDDIDPTTGHNCSRTAYDDVRASWRRHVQMHGWSEDYDRPRLDAVLAWWRARRPEFVDGDDWLAGLPLEAELPRTALAA